MARRCKSSPPGRRQALQGQIASAADLYFIGPMGISRRFVAIFRNGTYATYGALRRSYKLQDVENQLKVLLGRLWNPLRRI